MAGQGAELVKESAQFKELRTEKFGAGTTPISMPVNTFTQTYSTASRTHPAPTATLVGVDTGTDMTAAQAATIVADILALNKLVVALIDDLQSAGVLG